MSRNNAAMKLSVYSALKINHKLPLRVAETIFEVGGGQRLASPFETLQTLKQSLI